MIYGFDFADMSKFRLFLENLMIYGLGGVISKMIPLIMVPVITRLMPDTRYFGISDLSGTIVSIASALAVMGMYDAMYRLFFEKNKNGYKKDVCSTALIFTIINSFILFLSMILFQRPIARVFFHDENLDYVVCLSAFSVLASAANSIISAPARMQNMRKVFLITNTAAPLLSYSVAVLLLLKGYYVIALPLAGVVSGAVMGVCFAVINRKWFSIHRFNKKILKQLLWIAVPLCPNFLIYWVFNSSDRVMISNLLSVEAVGIYSVGAKLGHASQLIYTAFAGGWQYFAFSTMREEDQVEVNSKVFEYLGAVSFIAASFICAWSYDIYKMIFTGDYVAGYVIAPYLFLAPLLQMLFQVIGNQFLVIKKTWFNMLIMLAGAAANVGLNLILIPLIGLEGASIATLCGYIVTDIVCVIVLLRMRLMVLSKRFVFLSFLMFLYFVIWRLYFSVNLIEGTLAAAAFTTVCILLYKDELRLLTGRIRGNV